MLQSAVAMAIIIIFYVCATIIVFAPTLCAIWLYLIDRKVSTNSSKMLKALISTLAINAVFAYVLYHFATEYLVNAGLAEKDALAVEAVSRAAAFEEQYFARHGRYYPLGPVRGPYKDELGLVVEKDVVLEVEPVWDKDRGKDAFKVCALHVWGSKVVFRRRDGTLTEGSADSEEAIAARGRLLRSVR